MESTGPAKPPTQLLTIHEVAARLGYSKRKVWSMLAAGELRAIRLSRRATRIEESEIERFIARKRSESYRQAAP